MPTQYPLRVSVVIGTRNRMDELRSCLASVTACLGQNDEVIVVDSASCNGSAVKKIAEAAQARYFREDVPGAARARNVGIRHSRGEIVAFTDDDAIVAPDWLEKLLIAFEDKRVATVVGPVFELGSEPKRLLIEFRSFQADQEAVSFSRGDRDWFDRLAFGAIGAGANLAVRRQIFERVGMFKESLGQGTSICGDENFFLFNVVSRGFIVMNQPTAEVFHPLQLTQRLADIEESSVAYLGYLFIHSPRYIPRSLMRLTKGLWNRLHLVQGREQSTRNLARAILKAPGLLLASYAAARRQRKNGP